MRLSSPRRTKIFVDILAGVLHISDDDRRDLRSWYERHTAVYKITSVKHQTLEALNVVSEQKYQINIDMPRNPFKRGQVVFGSLVPWRREWYWSGLQRLLGDVYQVDVDEIVKTMKRQSSAIVSRYDKEYAAQAKRMMAEMHEKTLAYHGGKDLTVYPDGLAMAADWQNELQWHWAQRRREEVEAAVRKHGLKKGRPQIRLPNDLLEEENGLGVFLNP